MAEIDTKALQEAADAVKSMQKAQDEFLKEQKEISTKAQKELDDLKKELETTKAELQKKEIADKANQEVIDKFVAKEKQIQIANPFMPQTKTFAGELFEKLTPHQKDLDDYKSTKKGFAIEMDTKVVGNMASATSLTGTLFVQPTIVPGVVQKLYEQNHVRDFVPVGSTNSNLIRYIQDNGGQGGPTTIGEGLAKPQSDRALATVDSPVRKIATYYRIPEEMINDIPYLSSFISAMGLEELRAVEDNQLLYGDGTGVNLTGFNVAGTAFAAGVSIIGASSNEFDVIGAAKKQIRMSRINGPYVAFVSPINYFDMRYKRKDTTNNYIFQAPSLSPLNVPLQADGVQIVENTNVTAGDFFVFAPTAAQIFDRTGTTVRFYDQDQDNAIKNLITVVIEERLALAVYRPLGIIRGTFATAITDLTS